MSTKDIHAGTPLQHLSVKIGDHDPEPFISYDCILGQPPVKVGSQPSGTLPWFSLSFDPPEPIKQTCSWCNKPKQTLLESYGGRWICEECHKEAIK